MNAERTDAEKEVLDDLLREKSLWAIFRQSWRIPFSRTNLFVGVGVGVAVYCCSSFIGNVRAGSVADTLHSLATVGFSTSIGLLGFLLAGFAFFATVSDRLMFCRMAEVKHAGSGLSYLKYNFFGFMRVFCEYLVFAFACLLAVYVAEQGSPLRKYLSNVLTECDQCRLHSAAIALGVFSGAFVYLLMQLKSFIFNVYHVVMTSIRWSLEDRYDQETENTEDLDQEPK